MQFTLVALMDLGQGDKLGNSILAHLSKACMSCGACMSQGACHREQGTCHGDMSWGTCHRSMSWGRSWEISQEHVTGLPERPQGPVWSPGGPSTPQRSPRSPGGPRPLGLVWAPGPLRLVWQQRDRALGCGTSGPRARYCNQRTRALGARDQRPRTRDQ